MTAADVFDARPSQERGRLVQSTRRSFSWRSRTTALPHWEPLRRRQVPEIFPEPGGRGPLDDVYTNPLGIYIYMTLYLIPRRCGGGSNRAHRRNRQSSLIEPVTRAAPPDATIEVSVTVRVVPMPQGRATELERVFTPMHEQMAAGLPAPDV